MVIRPLFPIGIVALYIFVSRLKMQISPLIDPKNSDSPTVCPNEYTRTRPVFGSRNAVD